MPIGNLSIKRISLTHFTNNINITALDMKYDVYDVLCKSIVNNLLFKHNVTIIDFIGAYTRAAWHNFASELFGT